MIKEQAKLLLPIITAFAEGKLIEIADNRGKWHEIDNPVFNDDPKKYRIKPEPKYRPFKNAEECWNEMMKHQPFGWVKYKSERSKYSIYCNVDNNADFEADFDDYEFSDGTPFGTLKEE